MLRLICGPDRLETTQTILNEVCARAKAGQGGNILIVPEQYSHETERALCRVGGDTISRYAEVLSFTRLASRIAASFGGVCEEYLDEGGRLLTMVLAVHQVLPELKYYASAVGKPSFLQQLASAVEEFLSFCLTPQDIFRASERSEGQFAQKLRELALLYESYLSLCKTGRGDPVTRLYRLREQLFETDYAADKTFFLDGFSDFTAAQLQIVQTLLPQANLTVALPLGGDEPVFSTSAQTVRTLRALAARENTPVTMLHTKKSNLRTPDTQRWLDALFTRSLQPGDVPAPHLLTHQSESVAAECAFAAAYVRQLTASGTRYRDITIAVTDPGAYLPVLRAAFARAGIPAYFAGTTPLLQSPVVGALRDALHAAQSYEYEAVFGYLRSALSPLPREAVDQLERYAHRWALRGLVWEQAFTLHPRGFGEPWTEKDRQMLAALERWRNAAISALKNLRRKLKAAQRAAQQVEAVAELLEELGLSETLAEQSRRQNEAGQPQRAQQTEQLYEYLLQALEQFWQIAGEQPMEAEEFLQLLDLLLGCYQIGTIPAKADEVLLGPLPSMRHRQTPYLVILGAEEGKFPAFQTPVGLLSETERVKLLSLGLTLAPAQEARLERELGWIYAALCAATGTVVLSTGGGQPSYLLERTQQLFPACGVLRDEDYPYLPDAMAAAVPFVRQEQMERLAAYPVLSRAAEALQARTKYTLTPLKTETVRSLYGAEVWLSASKIDKFSACKYQYFLQYGLKSEPWRPARFDAPMFGTFVHEVLEQTVRDVMAQGGFEAVSERALLLIAQTHIDHYAKTVFPDETVCGARLSYLFARSRREVLEIVADLGRELRKSAFRPVDMELSFAPDGALPPVTLTGTLGRSRLTGYVDRVDLYDAGPVAYYRVIDYKTGRKEFDYASILEGEGLQMLVYLFALRRFGAARYGKPILPAGVLYVPSRSDVERIDPGGPEEKVLLRRQKKRRRRGLVLDDGEILHAMEQSEPPEYLPVQEKKGERTGDIASREQFTQLEQFTTTTLEKLTDALLSGAIAPDPLVRGPMHASCQFCDYRAACHQDLGGVKPRYIASVKPEQFWNEVERRLRDGDYTDNGPEGGR